MALTDIGCTVQTANCNAFIGPDKALCIPLHVALAGSRHPAVGAGHRAMCGICMHERPAYLDAVVGLGDAHIQDLAVRLKQLALAVRLPQLLLS